MQYMSDLGLCTKSFKNHTKNRSSCDFLCDFSMTVQDHIRSDLTT